MRFNSIFYTALQIKLQAVSLIFFLLFIFIYLFSGYLFSEMVTVCSSPRSPNSAKLFDGVTETEYLKMAKKGGGHKGKCLICFRQNLVFSCIEKLQQ